MTLPEARIPTEPAGPYTFNINLRGIDWIINPPPAGTPPVQTMREELFAIAREQFQPLEGMHPDSRPMRKAYGQFVGEWARRVHKLVDDKQLVYDRYSLFAVGSEHYQLMGTETDWADAGVIVLPYLPLTHQVVAMPEGALSAAFFFEFIPEREFRQGPNNPRWIQALAEARAGCAFI